MVDQTRTVMEQLTDITVDEPLFFIAALPWTRAREQDDSPPQRKIFLTHATQTLADYATLEQLDSHVSLGYNSLLIGQRIGLLQAGEVTAAWPVDNTGWPWTGARGGGAWAFRHDPSPGYQRTPASSRGFVVAQGSLTEVIDAAESASIAHPDEAIVVAGECFFEAHWH